MNSDGFSTLTASYSLSDTIPLVGASNLNLDPLFTDPTILNFELQPSSLATLPTPTTPTPPKQIAGPSILMP